MAAGRVPKTQAINIYLRALQKREPQWTERIEQVCSGATSVKRVAESDFDLVDDLYCMRI